MSKNVHYDPVMRQRAIAQKRFLVTIEVYGGHLKDDSVCVQAGVELAEAKKLAKLAVRLLNGKPKQKVNQP